MERINYIITTINDNVKPNNFNSWNDFSANISHGTNTAEIRCAWFLLFLMSHQQS